MLLSKNQKLPIFNSFYRTKEWWIFLSTFLFVFIPLIFIWLFYGELNFSKLNWLIAKNQRLWCGDINDKNIDELAKKFGDFYEGGSNMLKTELLNKIGKNRQILSDLMILNTLIFIPCAIILIWSIVYPIILYFLKISNLDVIPFSATIGIAGNGLIFSNLIPHHDYFLILRIIIIITLILLSFILSNFIVNKIISHIVSISKQKRLFFCSFPDETKKVYLNDLQKKVSFWKKNRKNNRTFVEIKKN